jgi:hypothetical protein
VKRQTHDLRKSRRQETLQRGVGPFDAAFCAMVDNKLI